MQNVAEGIALIAGAAALGVDEADQPVIGVEPIDGLKAKHRALAAINSSLRLSTTQGG